VGEGPSRRISKNLLSQSDGEGLACRIQRRFSMWNVPDIAPVLGVCALGLSTVCVFAIVFWYRARDKEVQVQREMRIREMEHQQKMRELEVELEKAKARQV
jgi:hypothetical protein